MSRITDFMYEFKMSFAGICVAVRCRYPQVRELCRDYLTQTGKPDFSFEVSDAELTTEAARLPNEAKAFPWFTEFNLIFRGVMSAAPYFGVLAVHGAAISYCDAKGGHPDALGYIFTAPSGTGKSTHIKLWKKYLAGKVDIINGDKPVISFSGGDILISSTPWSGKEGWQRNCSVRLGGVCILTRGKENTVKRVKPGECLHILMNQIFVPVSDPGAASLSLELFDRLCRSWVPFYLLSCDVSEEAVAASFSALTGNRYERTRQL